MEKVEAVSKEQSSLVYTTIPSLCALMPQAPLMTSNACQNYAINFILILLSFHFCIRASINCISVDSNQ